MLIGYACISPDDPQLAVQRKALNIAGCGEIFHERGSLLRVRARQALGRALDACARGDVLVVWRLGLLGRSPAHAIEILHNLAARGVGLRSLTDGIDLTAPDAALTLRVIDALAEFQHRIMTHGDRGRLRPAGAPKIVRKPRNPVGCPRKLTPEQVRLARQRIEGGETGSVVAGSMDVSCSTLYREFARLRDSEAGDSGVAKTRVSATESETS
jgi:DNA invertase Pin-like site-specific DNA recombinase